ncbi:MAG: isoprenylcysteine carboxylmethyltransferase family protein [Nitrospirae bacterium]|nr:isoprenylcysteine carboxylmethyltransferase family protein [Nitrospirota bacterium]
MRDPYRHNAFRLIARTAYKARVPILLALFLLAMRENSLHPFPLWAEILRILGEGRKGISAGMRHLALLLPVGLYVGALMMRLSATITLGSKTVWGSEPRSSQMVREGLFSCIRHPLYAGSAGMIFSLSLMSSPEGAAILSGGGILFLVFLARHEEGLLLRNLPEYEEYRKTVPAFIPSKIGACRIWEALTAPLRRDLPRGLRSEGFNVALLGGFLAFWATPSLPLFWISFALFLGLALSAPLWIPERTEERP